MIEIIVKTVPHSYRSKYMRSGYSKGRHSGVNRYTDNSGDIIKGDDLNSSSGDNPDGNIPDEDQNDNPLG